MVWKLDFKYLKIYTYIITIILFITNFACSDVADNASSIAKERIFRPLSKDDSLGYMAINIINLGDIKSQRIADTTLLIRNNSDTLSLSIYSLEPVYSTGIELHPVSGYPIIIKPNQDNSDNIIQIEFNTNKIAVGSYTENFSINGSKKYSITVTANVVK